MSSDGHGGDSPVPTRGPGRGGDNGNDHRKEFVKKERIGGGMNEGPIDDSFAKYLRNLAKERDAMDPDQFPSIYRLVQSEVEKLSKGSYGGFNQDPIFIDLYNDPPVTLHARAMPPSRMFPKFNYAGRIIGPKGSYLKALMKETTTKMVLLGKGVMKDKEKEEELRRGSDPKYFHLNEDMHVSITVTAPASDAYKRMANAIHCLKEQVLSDNRALEGLPWISNANRILEGGRPDPPRYSGARSNPQGLTTYRQPPPSYDYGEPASPVYRRSYHHEMSPPPRGPDPMKSGSYGGGGDPYRRVDNSRGMDYMDRRGSGGGGGGAPMRGHVSRSPPPRTYPTAYEESFGGYYSTTADPYYPDSDPYFADGSYNSRSPTRGGAKSTHTARYAPYKK